MAMLKWSGKGITPYSDSDVPISEMGLHLWYCKEMVICPNRSLIQKNICKDIVPYEKYVRRKVLVYRERGPQIGVRGGDLKLLLSIEKTNTSFGDVPSKSSTHDNWGRRYPYILHRDG